MRRSSRPTFVAIAPQPGAAISQIAVIVPHEAAAAIHRVPDRLAFLPARKESPRARAVDLAISSLARRRERLE
jgi:hypothetical protein